MSAETKDPFHEWAMLAIGELALRDQECAKEVAAKLRAISAQAPSAPVALDERAAFETYFCGTLSCDGSESQELIDACRASALDAWTVATRRAVLYVKAEAQPLGYVTADAIKALKALPEAFATFKGVMVRNKPVNSCKFPIYAAAPTPPTTGEA